MPKSWKVLYYEDRNGDSEVFDFINSKAKNERAKILGWLSLLEEKGPNVPRPYADLLEDGIHELKIKLTGKQMRILYFFCYKDFIILTNTFEKHTSKVPLAEIKKAKAFRTDYLNRYAEATLRKEYDENI